MRYVVALGLMLLGGSAQAQAPMFGYPINGTEAGAGTTTLGTSPATIQAASTVRRYLVIQDQTPAAQIACRMDGGTPAINDGVSYQIGGSTGITGWLWQAPGFVPLGAVSCISNTASTTVLVRVF